MTMQNNRTVALLGGDRRQLYVAEMLSGAGLSVRTWGLPVTDLKKDIKDPGWQEVTPGCDAVILPLPATRDGVHLFTSPEWEPPRMESLLAVMEGGYLLGGNLSEALLEAAGKRGIRCRDYYRSERLQEKNALPSAEGAIAIALQALPVTLCGTKVSVIGYGRIGGLLAERLHALGARVTVAARRPEVRVAAEWRGADAVDLGDTAAFARVLSSSRVIFNTVPVRVLTRECLEVMAPNTLIIDLASAPGGVDPKEAESLGIEVIWATALPGRTAPESAGIYLGEEILTILSEDI